MKVFLFLCFLVFLATAEKQKPFKTVVSHLHDYSSATGGFTLNKRELPSLEATYYALQLSTLYGTRQQLLKTIDVTPFIETLQNGDFGYGRRPGVASDLTSLRQAVFSYKLMGYAVPDSDKAATYVRSLLNKATGLFANRVEEEGSIQATAFALQVLDTLGELKEKPAALQTYLKTANTGDHFNTDSDDLNELADNYFALVVASLVNYKIDNPSKWATYILNKQDKTSGGFGSFQETAYAVASLKLLSQNKENFVDKLALDSLSNYVQTASDDLRDLVFAHLAVAHTRKFQDNFDIVVSYQAGGAPIKGDIVQGTLFKPVLSVKNHNGVAHAGLDAEVVVSFAGATLLESELQYQEDHKQYVSEQSVDTSGKLGTLTVKVVGSVSIPGFGDISLRVTDNKRVGYGIVVDSHAFSDVTGKEISEGEAVNVGTAFKFTVTLHNKTVHNLLAGDFTVDFKFLDSSNAVIASSQKEAKNNKDAIVFQYTLKSAAIPAGQLAFSFEVANKEGVHTQHVVKYLFNIPMIASQIVFDQASAQYKIGDKVRISAVPANYPDLRSVTPLESKDAAGKDVSGSRAFFVDVHSPHGLLLKSVQGVPNKGKLNFEVDVENTLDLIGNNVVSFRYQPAEGASIPLANYDSQLGELYQDSFVLNFTVNADLYVSNLKGTVKTELFYGNQVEFNFTVQDGLTKRVVKAGKQEKANVYLLLQHKDEDRPKIFTSSQHAATQVGDAFTLSYTIDPNAVQGAGILALIAQGADGNTLPLYKSGSSKQELKYDVTIGGKIDFQSKTYTQSSVSNKLASLFHETSFVVEFSLSCQGKVLKDAVLKCNVSSKSGFSSFEPLFSVPVATNNNGVYSTSWILPHEQPTTDYVLQCYREIDRIRALESKEFKEKRKRKEKEAKGENPNDVPEEPLVLAPFFEIPVHHQSQDSFKLPIRTEVLVTSILAAGFVAAYYKMSVYTTSK